MSFKPIVQSRRQWNPPNKENEIFYRTTVYKYNKSDDGKLHKVVIRIGREIIKKLDWSVGKKIIMLQNEENPLHLKLQPNEQHGYVLKPAVIPQGETYKDQKGKLVRCYFEGTIDGNETIPRTNKTTVKIIDWSINKDGLEIKVPRDL